MILHGRRFVGSAKNPPLSAIGLLADGFAVFGYPVVWESLMMVNLKALPGDRWVWNVYGSSLFRPAIKSNLLFQRPGRRHLYLGIPHYHPSSRMMVGQGKME
jgi:hypothetical protein